MNGARPPRTAVSWALIAVACLGIVVGNAWAPAGPDETDDTTRRILLRLQGKVLVAAARFDRSAVRGQLTALEAEAVTPGLARDLAVLRAEIDAPDGEPSEAAAALLEGWRDDLDSDVERALHDAVARAVADPAALTRDDRERIVERMGWFGRLAVSRGAPEDDPDRRALVAEAMRALVSVFTVFAAGAVGVLAGFVLLGIAGVRAWDGAFVTRFRPPGPEAAWYLRAFALYVAMFFALQILPVVFDDGPAAALSFVGLFVASGIGAAWPVLRGVDPARFRSDLGLHRGAGVVREAACGVIGYVAILPIFAAGFMTTLVLMAGWEAVRPDGAPHGPVSHPIVPMIAEGGTGTRLAVLFLAAAFAPLFEELLFRGALFTSLRRRFRPVAAGVVVGVLFAAIHPQGLLTVPALGSLAFGFALLREWRGSLIAPMVGHAIHNGALVAAMWLALG